MVVFSKFRNRLDFTYARLYSLTLLMQIILISMICVRFYVKNIIVNVTTIHHITLENTD